ncbi:glycine-rich domain-containing protein [Pedobacter xixiisoli]|uniref:Por secretion system C-terminal sorting domain-containing protein n=1 Tax=Pedobacter xixiisoli TaxID=1476464 RepID=A0A286AAQ5_9SPHI|nr:T9SS type A sorting domain-containing protein [Pedobacter xixiisoli]SOD18980.1 Por secretion system C-terminal sorting domain-containing protein [Pedobacter xixiisoli]
MRNSFTLILISYFILGVSICFGQTKENYIDGGILYARVIFKTSGNWSVPQGVTSVNYLVVGGGGGGGAAYDAGAAGGGGGAHVLTGNLNVSAGTSVNVTIGIGGTGGTANRNIPPYEYGGNNGGSSSFGSITANGGTGGQASRTQLNGFGGAVNTGGNGGGNGVSGGSVGGGGGGGGATSSGSTGNSSSGGNGGAGTSSSLSGAATIYGNGGNGGRSFANSNGSTPTANTGNGGAGAGSASSSSLSGRNGADGIVIFTYPEVDPVLPVSFKMFNAVSSANAINLHWQTTSEQNNSHFIIKRSKDGVNFENFANIDGKGNSSETNSYNLVDKKPNVGTNYYQLSQVDHNGKTTLLSTQSASFGTVKINSSVYPNPFTNSVNANFEQGIFEKAVLSDLSGKVLASIAIEKEQTNCTFKTDRFPSGIYFIKLSGKQSATYKVIKP